jgi:hypothetical protein
VQNARDTFYATLRDRIAGINPARTVVVRGSVRPGVVVVENELAAASVDGLALTDAFCLRWIGVGVDARSALPMVSMTCEIRYATDGTAGNAGMDRGRALSEMDAELAQALDGAPHETVKVSFASGVSVAMATNVFWGDVAFGAAIARSERLERTATVEVYSYQEAGEL